MKLPYLLPLLLVVIPACQDAITTSDPRNIHTTPNSSFVAFDSASYSFGNVDIGRSVARSLTLRDTDDSHGATIKSATITGLDGFMFSIDVSFAIPQTLAPHGFVGVPIRFAPSRPGPAHGLLSLSVESSTGMYLVMLPLTGIGLGDLGGADFSVDVAAIDFGSLQPTTMQANNMVRQIVRVRNTGAVPLVFTHQGDDTSYQNPTVSITIPSFTEQFSPDAEDRHARTLQPDSSMPVVVWFHPNALGDYRGFLAIQDTARTKRVLIPLKGEGNATGYPFADTFKIPVDTSRLIAIDTFLILHNRLPFPLTFSGSDDNSGYKFIVPHTDYSLFPVTIAPGDSLKYEFLYKGGNFSPAAGGLVAPAYFLYSESYQRFAIATLGVIQH